MKAFLLTAFTIAAATVSVSAQSFRPDFPLEFGIYGGLGGSTIPTGPASQYTGGKSVWNGTYGATFDYNLSDNLQVGGEVNVAKWSSTANWNQSYTFGQTLEQKKVTFNIANPALSFMAHFNYMMPEYSSYKEYIKGNFYYGISLGLIASVNDGSIAYTAYNDAPAPTYTYVSQYNYGMGIGFTAGVQVGYTYYATEHFGINLQVAGRYATVGTNDVKYAHENSNYHLFYFPCTIGIHYRI
jgi:hypothetical protein